MSVSRKATHVARGHSQILAESLLHGNNDRPPADLVVLLRGTLSCALRDLDVYSAHVDGDLRFEKLEEALDEDTLEELHIA